MNGLVWLNLCGLWFQTLPIGAGAPSEPARAQFLESLQQTTQAPPSVTTVWPRHRNDLNGLRRPKGDTGPVASRFLPDRKEGALLTECAPPCLRIASGLPVLPATNVWLPIGCYGAKVTDAA